MTIAAAFLAGGLERAAHRREDGAWQAATLAGPDARVLPIWRGRPLVCGGQARGAALIGAAAIPGAATGGLPLRLGWLAPGHPVLADAAPMRAFLGMLPADGQAPPIPVFGAEIDRWTPADLDPAILASGFDASEHRHPLAPPDHLFADLRAVMSHLPPAEAEAAATARGLIGWHGAHGHCARCGSTSEVVAAGWQRRCPACGAHHFPRTDPVVIMLVQRGDRLLLGRSPGWPEGMYSLLAGFMEPGETIEDAVRREVAEETGIRVGAVRYVASQPWPFPASLMIGCVAEALDERITRDPAELEDARWVPRAEVLAASAGHHPALRPARRGAIAHGLIRAWLEGRI